MPLNKGTKPNQTKPNQMYKKQFYADIFKMEINQNEIKIIVIFLYAFLSSFVILSNLIQDLISLNVK